MGGNEIFTGKTEGSRMAFGADDRSLWAGVANRGHNLALIEAVFSSGREAGCHGHFFGRILVLRDGPAGAGRAGLRVMRLCCALVVKRGDNLAFVFGRLSAVGLAPIQRTIAGVLFGFATHCDADRVAILGDITGDAQRQRTLCRGAARPKGRCR